MTYTPPTPKAIKPSDVYLTMGMASLDEALSCFTITDFRPVIVGDTYLDNCGRVNTYTGLSFDSPRFILQRVEPRVTIRSVWE